MTEWHTIGGSALYAEKVFPNRKVGHVSATTRTLWRCSLDGVPCGSAFTREDAQALVEYEYEMRYERENNGVLDRSHRGVFPRGDSR
jgi:hypothetical protein